MKQNCANSNFARLLHPLLQCNFTVEMSTFIVELRKCSLFIFLALLIRFVVFMFYKYFYKNLIFFILNYCFLYFHVNVKNNFKKIYYFNIFIKKIL